MSERILRKSWLIGLSVVALGCGGSNDETGGTTPEEPMDSDEPTPPETSPGDDTLQCDLSTDWAGDEFCIQAPPEGQGFQLHYGPTDYDDPDDVAPFLLDAGGETNIVEVMTSGNSEDIFFYKRQYRMRPGSHHLIVSERGGAGSFVGGSRRLGGSQNTFKDNPSGELPPENEGIGMPLQANAELSVNLHHFNGTDTPILREAWVNFWYVDESDVTQEAKEIFLWAQGPSVPPNSSDMAKGRFEIGDEGRILTLYGHRHSNAVRFSAYRTRDGERELVYEDYDWEEPAVLEFNSLVDNEPPDGETLRAGGRTGVLDLVPGDVLEWECEIVNERSFTITFGANEAETSEMCILVGDAIGPELLGFSL